VQMSRHAQSTGLMYLVQMPVDRLVLYAVAPLDHLSRMDTKR
jgi:hypothetical protein